MEAYKASIEKIMQQAQLAQRTLEANANIESDREKANAIQKFQKSVSQYQLDLEKYKADLDKYTATIAGEVRKYELQIAYHKALLEKELAQLNSEIEVFKTRVEIETAKNSVELQKISSYSGLLNSIKEEFYTNLKLLGMANEVPSNGR